MKNHLLTYSFAGAVKSFSPKEGSAQKNAPVGKSPKLNFLIFILALLLFVLGQKGYSQTATFSGATGGNWNVASNWTITAPVAAARVPLATDNVVIPNNKNVNITANAVCASLTINSGLNANTVAITGAFSLSITNALTINAPTVANVKQLTVGTGTLNCGSIVLANTLLATADCQVTATTGTINVTDDITMSGDNTKNAIIFTAGGTLNLGGDMSGGLFTAGTSTVNCTGANPQVISAGFNALSVPVGYVFNNLNVAKTSAANTVNFTTAAFTVNADFSVTTGNAIIAATDANYTVINDVTIGTNGTFINTVDYLATTRVLNVGGDWTCNGAGVFTAGSGMVNFNTTAANQAIQGTSVTQLFNSITLNKTGRSLTVAGSTTTLNLSGSVTLTAGTFVAGTATNILVAGDWTNNGATFTPGTGTVTFTSSTAAQNINGTAATQTFNNITVSKSGQQLNVAGSTTTLTMNGSMTLTAGTFAAGTAATINIAGNWTNNGATFTPGTGTVNFNSTTATQNINGTAAAQSFNNITVTKGGQQLNVAGSTTTLNLGGNMTLTSGTLAAGTAADINMTGGNWINNGGTFTPGSGTVTFNSTTANQNIQGTATTQSFNNIVVNKAGFALNGAGSTTTLNLAGDMTITAGTFAAGTATTINMTGGDWINNGGTFTPGSGLVNFNSTIVAQYITGTVAAQTFNNITVNKTGQQLAVSGSTTTLNLNGTMLLTAGTLDAGTAANINVAGNWTNNGATFLPGTGTVTFNSTTATQNINGTATAQSFNNVVVNKAGQTLNVAGSTATLNVAGSMTLTAGTFAAGTATNINMTGGDWINNGGTFTPGSGTVTFNSTTAAQNITGTAATQTFNNLTINKAGQQLNVAGSTATLTLNGAVTITAGTFAAGTATNINVAGNWVNNGTAFVPGSGRVTFNGGTAQTISGSTITDFYNVTLNNSNGLTLTSVDVNINGAAAALTFTNGKITTGTHTVNLLSSGTISGAGTGKYVYGNLQLGVATGSPTRVFEIGDAAAYAPISVVFNSVTVAGDVTAYTTGTEHPNILTSTIDETLDVNRYWTMTNSGVSLTTYVATFNFLATDIDAGANTANFIVARRTSSWGYPTTTLKNPTNITATMGSFGTYACGEGGAGVPTMVTQPLDLSGCTGGSIAYTAAANVKPTGTVTWQISTDNGATFNNLTIASPYSVSTSSASGVTTSTLTINPTVIGMDGYSYRAVFTNNRGSVNSFDGSLTLTASPTANAGSALSAICGSGTSAALGGSVGGSATGGTWSTPAGGTFTPSATNLNATWTPPVGFSGTATLTLTTSGGSCGTATASKTQVVAANAAAVSITPSTATICVNAIQSLAASNSETSTYNSGTVNVAIPDNSAAGATNTIAVSGIPTGATITGLSVTINVNHTKDQDLIMNLRAPNGNILNLVNTRGGSGSNFTNTVINSTSTTAITGSAPFTGTFRPDASSGVGATGQVSNVTTFASLYSTTNGNWVFSARDQANTNTGTISSWSLTITYLDPITWSPVTYLYTNAAATVAYTAGTVAATVYAKPSTASTTTYTATATNAGGCTATQTTTVTAGPIVTITPDYCYGGGYIQLQASSTPAATSWLWSTGATTSSILVNLAGNYTATATTSAGCVASATAPIAQELVTNGSFSSGNTGFTSSYGFVPYTSGCMYPEGIYTVGSSPNFTHGYFFGADHTTGSGNMLIVNGSSTPVYVWQQVLTVQPNTTYYFSAWAMSLNDAGPFAQLQFNINGSLLGTTAVLPSGPNSTSAPYTWVQFYGSWTSGAGVTSATVSIRDLQTATGGNDFGVDDISFGTLSTFLSLTSGSGSDTQTVCRNTPITNITYAVGAGATGPSVTGLPTGVNWSFNGTTLTISGTPTTAGTYSYTVTNSTCNPITKNGLITVTQDTLTLTSAAGTDAQSACLSSAITPITYSVSSTATGATVTGLPPGVSYSYSSGVLTISGTPTTASNYTYTVTTTGTCYTATTTGTIYVRRHIISRTSATGTNAQSLCINTAITNITYAIGGVATGAGVTGLPTGVTGSYSSGVFTISGTPTAAPGVYSYVVTTTGPCNSVTATGSITVNGPTVTLTSAVGTDAQTVCINTAMTNITYSIGGTATGVASVTGLPTGVSWSFNATTLILTISGTPTVSGVNNYVITTSGGSCGTTTANGSLTVSATNTVTLTSAAGTDAQAGCINTAITNITYSTTGATGATFSGLPTGVSGAWASNVVTISGTPTVAGTSTYTVTLTGGCGTITATGTITVIANNTITLSSAVGTNAQTLCINTAITNITYSTTGATGATFSGLPTGVSGAWASNVVTISGTPTVAGTSTYTVTLTGGCGNITATGTIAVTANNTITLTSAAGTNAQTRCINTAITNITYSTTGATGATFSGLPTGVSGAWASNVVTISGTPTVAGTSTYTVTLTGGCGTITATGTIAVTANNTITLTSAAGTNAQTVCINTAITNITYSTTGATGATFSGLPTGVSGAWASNVVTISGTPTVAGTSTYTVTLTGGCGSITATGTITVSANNTITLTSAVGTNAQTRCINTAITNITYSTTGATGATFSGLPTGVSGAWASNVVTISGTPTVAGTATYTVTLTGGCGTITATGTITVNVNTVTLTSAAGTNAQTRCINTAITNITYSTTGATGATFSGLPTGVSGAWASNVVTISGTPTVAGTSTYTVTLTGGCGTVTATGTITVTANNTITLSSAAGTNAQTVCINTAITNITYSTTGATGATFSGLPAGVSGAWASNVVTISGTPTVAGTSTYTVTLTGGCGTITATGTITVTANNTITLSSAVGTNAQTRCINTAITNITYSTTGATGATFSGLPTGVSGAWASNVVTISGTPTVAGTATYTVTLTGGCGTITATGTITVTANNTITLSSAAGTDAQTRCINTAITNITYSTTGATGATFSGLPTGVSGAWASNVVTISGTPTVAGTSTYTVTLTGGCGTITATGTITVTANNTITLTSAVGTNAQTRCINTAITNITYSTTGATGATFSGLPTGVSGAWASNVVTISGTPTVAGTSTYTVTLTGGCGTITATGTITVTANNTITLSSAAGTDAQTRCINTAITNITYSTTGATGATFSGLPTGVSGAWASNVVTISGTPSVAGTATYTVTLTGGCGTITATGTITVTANNTITLTSAVGTNAQTRCINTAITNITYSTTGATGATFSGLPTGVSGAWASNVVTISGTPTVAGTSTYTVTLTGGCGTITATGTITVTANNTITLTSAVGTNAQTRCINTAITNITYSTTGATGATFSGLPTGVSGAWASNVVTISGTPTVAGTSTYTVTLTGGCGTITATGTITVTANNTITLSSAAGTNAQTRCINTSITNITYSTTGATGATFSGLPTGVSGAWASNVVTISGTPTVAGTSTYTVTLTGGCGTITTTGTITVTANNTITLSSAAGTDAQTRCINTAITNITYSTTGATGATFSGLPTGVSGAWASNVVTISGTPSVAGTSTYTVTLTGGCGSITATGTITVTANNTITLSSAAGTDAQAKCINTAITNITYSTTGATGATFSGLPTGVSGAWASNVVTISGTPTVAGTATYTVTLTGGCGNITATGTITVDATNAATLSSAAGTDAQTVCINTAVTNITYTIGGSATGASVSGLPAGVSGSYSAGVYTISGTPTASGTFNYIVTTTGGSCSAATASGSITVSPAPSGGTIADVSICYADNGTLTLTGNVGGVVRWETSNDLSSWTNISNTTTSQPFSGLTTTTWYRRWYKVVHVHRLFILTMPK
ncbi:MAG: proprotein convertase P-domain-containing protein [Ferruginibacter sp.]